MIALVVLLVLTSPAWGHHNKRFDTLFEQVARQHWSDTPHTWELLSELARAESSFRPEVMSHVGAVGLLQVMPGTWDEIKQHDIPDLGDDLTDPSDNIRAGSHYLRRMYNIWYADRTEEDRMKLSLASYNAGPGNLLKAQRLSGGANHFPLIARQLPRVTGSHAPGTIEYADKIWGRYQEQERAPPAPVVNVTVNVQAPVAPAAPPAPAVPTPEPLVPMPNDLSPQLAILFALTQLAKAWKDKDEDA